MVAGEEVPCELARVDGAALRAMSVAERKALLQKPLIVTNLIDDWAAHDEWATPQKFTERYGHHDILAKRVIFGIEQVHQLAPGRWRGGGYVAAGQGHATDTYAASATRHRRGGPARTWRTRPLRSAIWWRTRTARYATRAAARPPPEGVGLGCEGRFVPQLPTHHCPIRHPLARSSLTHTLPV